MTFDLSETSSKHVYVPQYLREGKRGEREIGRERKEREREGEGSERERGRERRGEGD